MPRGVGVLALLATSSLAIADDAPPKYDSTDPGQSLAASIGVATGSRITPGGLRFEGHYLYQVTQDDWIDTTASLTLGSGDPGCFFDRDHEYTCDHAIFDGKGVEVTGGIRHHFLGQSGFSPFTRVGVGLGLARFADDEVTGIALTLRGSGGIHVTVADGFAIVVEAELALGAGIFGHDLGLEGQLGAAVLAGGEFSLE